MTIAGALALLLLLTVALSPQLADWWIGWEAHRLWRQLKVAGVVHKCPVCRVEFIRRTEPKDVCPKCGTRAKGEIA